MDGYAAYPECLIFALAVCACQKSSLLLRTQAYKAVPKVCKHSRDLFLFASFMKKLSAPTSGIYIQKILLFIVASSFLGLYFGEECPY